MRQVECYFCKGKGTYPVAGFLAVLDWPCRLCSGTGKVDHPQDQPQPPPRATSNTELPQTHTD